MTSGLDQAAAGQATYGVANLRPERSGPSFIVFISQRDDARHAARVKVSPAPRVKIDDMGSQVRRNATSDDGSRSIATSSSVIGMAISNIRKKHSFCYVPSSTIEQSVMMPFNRTIMNLYHSPSKRADHAKISFISPFRAWVFVNFAFWLLGQRNWADRFTNGQAVGQC